MKRPVNSPSELLRYLGKIDRVFGVDDLVKKLSASEIARYYTSSSTGYDLFHSSEGSVHMALNYDGQFDTQGFEEQANIVASYLRPMGQPVRVLELGCGKGFNLQCLTQILDRSQLLGIDLTSLHLHKAHGKLRSRRNVHLMGGSFENLPLSGCAVTPTYTATRRHLSLRPGQKSKQECPLRHKQA